MGRPETLYMLNIYLTRFTDLNLAMTHALLQALYSCS